MPFLKAKCPICAKDATSAASFEIAGKKVTRLLCGHIIQSDTLNHSSPEHLISMDGKKLFPFQCDGIRFVESANAKCLIGDEMGLGKTVQALGTFALHPELLPCLWIGKSALKAQYQYEIMRWMGEDTVAQVIEDSRDVVFPKVPFVIVSYDLLRRIKDPEEKFKNIRTIVLDEVQQIKNTTSKRTVEVRKLCASVQHVIALSGTPIKNNASEYFPVLNILDPVQFNNYARFLRNDCDSYYDGYQWKTGGLANPETFKRKTKSFIIRRERAEVMPDLPTVTRNFQFHELSKEVEAAYKATFLQFREEFNEGGAGFEEQGNILAYLSKMRHLTGLSKIDPTIDFTMEFLGSTDRKLTIFVHHKDVADILKIKLSSLCDELNLPQPLQLASELDTDARAKVVTEFMEGAGRVLIASTLASGEGLNLQKCSDCIMLERQWNPANEEQAEGRFIRIGQVADKVTATYMVAIGTVDEFFSEIVERKREIVSKTLGGEAVSWDQSSIIKELSERLASCGGQRWSI